MSDNGESVGRLNGPLDDASWPSQLTARVVAPGARPTLHGYDVEADLAIHYSLAEATLLAFTGDLPTPEQARAFEVALLFFSPTPVNEAPTHAAVVARICNVITSAIVGTAAIGLAEQARVTVSSHTTWLRQLESADPVPTAEWASHDDAERRSVHRLRETLLASGVRLPVLEHDLSRTAALLATLRFAGLKHPEQLEAAIVLARLPSTLAEAFATPPHSFRDYPVGLPPLRYDFSVGR
jgi:hypothetical protein